MGIVFQRNYFINRESLKNAISDVLKNDNFTLNTIKISKIVKDLKNPREEFKYWLDFVLKHGYDCLIIDAYLKNFSWIIVNGFDVAFAWVVIFCVLFWLLKKMILKCCCKGKGKEKEKVD